MASFNNNHASTGSSAISSTSTTATDNTSTGTASATIEGESAPEPDIPRLYVSPHVEEDDVEEEDDHGDQKSMQDDGHHDDEDEEEDEEAEDRPASRLTMTSSCLTLSALNKTSSTSSTRIPLSSFNANDDSLRIPREPAYGDDNADGDDDGNEEDIEDGDEYDDDDDLYDQLFDSHDPIARKAALEHASALFAQSHQNHQAYHSSSSSSIGVRRSNSTSSSKSLGGAADDMDEVERSFLRCTKPVCSKKQLVSCLSSRSTSPGPISPLLSDEDFGCISTATSSTNGSLPPSLYSGSSSTAPSSRRSSDGSHTPRVRFKKGCVITAVNLTWAPTTYDRAPIDVAESLDMHRCKNVEDAEGYAQDDEEVHCVDSSVFPEYNEETRGEWQAFAPGIYNASDLPVDLITPRAPPSPPAPSSPATAADAKYAYASTLSPSAASRISSPEESPSSSDCQSGFLFARSTVGYPLSRQCFEQTSSSSSSSESENDDIIERCRSFLDTNTSMIAATSSTSTTTIYRPTARSPVRHSIVSSMATVETSLGAAARELSDSLDESSRSSSPSLYHAASDDCLSSTPRAGDGASFMMSRPSSSRRDHYFGSAHSNGTSIASCVAARQANFDANGTHDTSPPPPEEQPARKVQRRLERRSSSSCSASRFTSSNDIWESCEALGGF
ncbi:hypothetical protein P389DRAFT_4469 [Cystobasidium minutum MCA 4210]|uniref:uncharacterized protein n=1 Tax=Cystobasidium minutum MCA 4210 TaxID=1397322 RepID=UPI0034CD4E5D|eukprot:jgi/Rhomi1/4469/CE4468_7131